MIFVQTKDEMHVRRYLVLDVPFCRQDWATEFAGNFPRRLSLSKLHREQALPVNRAITGADSLSATRRASPSSASWCGSAKYSRSLFEVDSYRIVHITAHTTQCSKEVSLTTLS